MSILEIENLSVSYDGFMALKNATLCAQPGEILALVGPSGCGKSTLAMAILGMGGTIETGTITLAGASLLGQTKHRWKQVAMVPQSAMNSLNPRMKIGAQIGEAMDVHLGKAPKSQRAEQVKSLLQSVDLDPKWANFYPHKLSGGMKQRVVIAMAISCNPQVLISDEATTGLDVLTQGQIMELYKKLAKERNMAILLISHDRPMVATASDRIALMDHGEIVSWENPQSYHTPTQVVEKSAVLGAPILEVKDLTKTFRDSGQTTNAVSNVSFQVAPGEILGIIGQSGSGKTTTAKLLLNMLKPDHGGVYFQGELVHTMKKSQWKAYHRQVQMVYQDPYDSLPADGLVANVLREPLKIHKLPMGDKIPQVLQQVGLEGYESRTLGSLSGGQRQRVAIARSLILSPKVLIADEPTSMLDQDIGQGIRTLLEQAGKTQNMALLYITHDIQTALHLCHRLAVMYQGKVVEQGTVQEILTAPQHPYTKALLHC